MPIYFVIFEYMQYTPDAYAVKQIHRAIPTTLDKIQEVYAENFEIFRTGPRVQFEIFSRPDNSHLEEIANNAH